MEWISCWWLQESYTFTVGYHELTGSKVTLKKPLLVLKKLQKCTDGSSEKETELQVVGIIRSKILFKTRPKPLFSGITSLFCSCLLLWNFKPQTCSDISEILVWFRNKLGCNCKVIPLDCLLVLPVSSCLVSYGRDKLMYSVLCFQETLLQLGKLLP